MSTLNNITTQLDSIKTDIVTCRSNLKTNLIDKGVEVSVSDKMSSLIDKVGTIPLGKKWASGVLQMGSESNPNISLRVATNLSFLPSRVYVIANYKGSSKFACKNGETLNLDISVYGNPGSVNITVTDISASGFTVNADIGTYNDDYGSLTLLSWEAYE